MITQPLYEVLTAAEAEKLLSLGKGTIRKYIANGKFKDLEYRKSGSTWLVTRDSLDRVFVRKVSRRGRYD